MGAPPDFRPTPIDVAGPEALPAGGLREGNDVGPY